MIKEIIFENDPIIGTKGISGLSTGINYVVEGHKFISRARDYINWIRGNRRLQLGKSNEKANIFFSICWAGEGSDVFFYRIGISHDGVIINEKLYYQRLFTSREEILSVSGGQVDILPGYWKLELGPIKPDLVFGDYIYPVLPTIEPLCNIMKYGFGLDSLNMPKENQRKYHRFLKDEENIKTYNSLLEVCKSNRDLRKVLPYYLLTRETKVTGVYRSYIDPNSKIRASEEIKKEFCNGMNFKLYNAQVIVTYELPYAKKVTLE